MKHSEIYLGAGCFWGVQKKFKGLDGVIKTEVGYAGGDVPRVNYEMVCSGETGHAEVVKVIFDPTICHPKTLLQFFLKIHDPTQLNRQGPDIGRQYRSVIFYQTLDEKNFFQSLLSELSQQIPGQVQTTLEELVNYNRAEDYHQDYIK